MNQTETRNHKIKCDYGMKDYYNHYSTNSTNPVSIELYRKILKDYLKAIKNAISNFGYTFIFPERMGLIEMRKVKREVKVDKNGNIINNLPINWKATKKLWEENEEAKKRKIKLRYTNEHTKGYVFRPIYIKKTANYKNKTIYKMQINRELRRNTYSSIINKRLDAFLLEKK